MPSLAHTHKYERRRLGSWKKSGHEVYKCALPGCSHYIVDMELVIGQISLCWGEDCESKVEMTRYLVFNEKRKRPLCESCKEESKAIREIKKLERKLDRLFNANPSGENDDNATIDN